MFCEVGEKLNGVVGGAGTATPPTFRLADMICGKDNE
jgi:hypothetical protein